MDDDLQGAASSSGDGDGADWNGMVIGFSIVGSLLVFDCLLFFLIFGVGKSLMLLRKGVRVPARIVNLEATGHGSSKEYKVVASYTFKGEHTVTYSDVMESAYKKIETERSAGAEFKLLLLPKHPETNTLATIADDLTTSGMIAYFGCLGWGFLIGTMIAAANLHADEDGEPNEGYLFVGLPVCACMFLAGFGLLGYHAHLTRFSKRRIVSGVIRKNNAAEDGVINVAPAPTAASKAGGEEAKAASPVQRDGSLALDARANDEPAA